MDRFWSIISKSLSAPVFTGDDEKTRVAALLNTALLTLAGIVFVLFLVLSFNDRVVLSSKIILVIVLFTSLGLQIPLRSGFVRQTSFLLVAMMTGIVTGIIIVDGSVRTPTGSAYFVLTSVMAGLFISQKAAWVSALVNSMIFLSLLWAEMSGYLPGFRKSVDSLLGLAFCVGAFWTVMLLNLVTRSISTSLATVRTELAERERMEASEAQRHEMLEKVIRLGKIVTEVADFRTVLLRIWKGIRNDLGFDRVGIFLYNASNNTLQGSYGTDREGNRTEEWQIEVSAWEIDFFGGVLSQPDGFYFTEDYEEVHNVPPGDIMSGVKYYAAVSAWAGEKPVAVLCVDQLLSGRPITAEQVEALRFFAGYVGLAIQNARLNANLEQRVIERTAQLEAANRELEAFSYSVSHDLRAPIRAINSFVKILSKDFLEEFSPQARNFLTKIIASADKMANLIDGLLNFSRLGRKPLNIQPVDLNEIVQGAIDSLYSESASRQIKWILPELPPANGDPVLIQQVCANLIGNAVKYTGQCDVARIEVGSFDQDGDTVYFVRDNGTGFDMQYGDKLFGVFQRLHREDEFEGTGIGLATVKRIIERHGGQIWAEAQPDQGATFYFTIP